MVRMSYFEDELGEKYRYVLCYLVRGWDEEEYSNNIEYLDKYAKDMIENNTGKPLIIVNGDDKVVKEYAKKLR